MSVGNLIEVSELTDQLRQGNTRIIDCRFSLADGSAGHRHYLEGHIPGAVYAHLNNDLSGTTSSLTGRHPLPTLSCFEESMQKFGINEETVVVAYDSHGGAFAARLWWLLKWVGHDSVLVLNGGLQAWVANGLDLEQGEVSVDRGQITFDSVGSKCMAYTTEQVLNAINNGEYLLVDARAQERFAGREEPIDPVAGHVPNAVNLPFKSNINDDGYFLSESELKEKFESLICSHSPECVIHMCGSGVTACHNILAMELAGLSGSKLYSGSWSEWICDPKRPVVTDELH